MVSKNISFCLVFFFFSCLPNIGFSQSLNHPVIWTTSDEKQQVLNLIETYDWAKSMNADLHKLVDRKVNAHKKNPTAILKTIPKIPADNTLSEFDAENVDTHAKLLTDAAYAGVLYYLTNEEKYAQFTADILGGYVEVLEHRTPETTTICGNHFYDPRIAYSQFFIAYDFIYGFLKTPNSKIFNVVTEKREPVDFGAFQKVILNMIGSTLQEEGKPDTHGKFISNHPILTAPGVLYGILCVEDDTERERLFNVFWEAGTAHQNSFKNTILPMFGKQGVWPESTSYSFMPIVTMVLNIIDRVYPEMNVTADYKNIFKGNFLFDNLRLPDGHFVRYGDSKRKHDGTQQLYRYTLDLAHRRGYKNLEDQAQVALRQAYERAGGYKPQIRISTFNNTEPLKLLWGIPIPKNINSKINFNTPTVIVEHAGIALQRNYVETDNELYGLCGIIGGAHYVHSHVTGITMELYGADYVMAPNAGLPRTVKERRIPLHENYFRLYAGNNTVIVNGTSHGVQPGSWKYDAYVWQNTVVNVAAEPKHLEAPVSKYFSFATQHLNDTINNCVQERTLSVIRTSDKTAYYLDVFRSKSLNENKFHDYVYHNIGDELLLKNDKGITLKTNPTTRYQNDIGDPVQSPGWRYFKETQSTEPLTDGIAVNFKIDYNKRFMHMFMPKGVDRSYTKAVAPPTREAKHSYDEKPTQVLVVRQEGEAWERPFISVFEPSTQKEGSIKSVEPLRDGKKDVGVVVVSEVNNKIITDYIICLDQPNGTYSSPTLGLKFKGRFGIVRVDTTKNKTSTSLYLGEGEYLNFGDLNIKSSDKNSSKFETFKK